MKYRLIYTHRAIRDIDALDTSVKQRIGKTLLRYASDPLQHAEPLKQSELGSYRFRIGDYCVVFDIEGDEIVVLRIGHRRDIYRRQGARERVPALGDGSRSPCTRRSTGTRSSNEVAPFSFARSVKRLG